MRLGRLANASAMGSESAAAASASRSVRKGAAGQADSDSEDDFDRERAQLANSEPSNGWKQELRAYLEDPALTVTKDCDTVEWWSVSYVIDALLIYLLTCGAEVQLSLPHSCSHGPRYPSHSCVVSRCRALVLTRQAGLD